MLDFEFNHLIFFFKKKKRLINKFTIAKLAIRILNLTAKMYITPIAFLFIDKDKNEVYKLQIFIKTFNRVSNL